MKWLFSAFLVLICLLCALTGCKPDNSISEVSHASSVTETIGIDESQNEATAESTIPKAVSKVETTVETTAVKKPPATKAAQEPTQAVSQALRYDLEKSRENSNQNATALKRDSSVYSNGSGNKISAGYVVNKNTKKFHYPNCRSVGKIKDKNKLYSGDSRESLIEKGYSPCKICRP